MVVIRHSPYSSSMARTALDIVLAAGAFEQPVTVLLYGDGVLQLLPHQQSDRLGTKNHAKQLAALPLYGIEKIYADTQSLTQYGVDVALAPLPVESISGEAVQGLLSEHDHVLGL